MVDISRYEQNLPENHYHYIRLERWIRKTMPSVNITAIRKVHNEYLSLAFAIKESETQLRRKQGSKVKEFIHATGINKVHSILRQNLNWRLVTRSKYGRGVSFSDEASYADKYCNNRNGNFRVFVICDVLVGYEHHVSSNWATHPPQYIDTFRSMNNRVLVKFDDFTFNPTFAVYYDKLFYITRSPSYHMEYDQLSYLDRTDRTEFETIARRRIRDILLEARSNQQTKHAPVLPILPTKLEPNIREFPPSTPSTLIFRQESPTILEPQCLKLPPSAAAVPIFRREGYTVRNSERNGNDLFIVFALLLLFVLFTCAILNFIFNLIL